MFVQLYDKHLISSEIVEDWASFPSQQFEVCLIDQISFARAVGPYKQPYRRIVSILLKWVGMRSENWHFDFRINFSWRSEKNSWWVGWSERPLSGIKGVAWKKWWKISTNVVFMILSWFISKQSEFQVWEKKEGKTLARRLCK